MRIIKLKSSGKLLEMQSNAIAGTLMANALAAGYSAAEVEEREISSDDFKIMLESAKPPVGEVEPTVRDELRSLKDLLVSKSVISQVESDAKPSQKGKSP